VQTLFAAAALGSQKGLTSSFREMAVRTTHFTGTALGILTAPAALTAAVVALWASLKLFAGQP
jgi:hypothetical protein